MQKFSKACGEIDIIAKDKNFLVFSYVKVKKNSNFRISENFVNNKKIKKIQEVAQMYMLEKQHFEYCFSIWMLSKFYLKQIQSRT